MARVAGADPELAAVLAGPVLVAVAAVRVESEAAECQTGVLGEGWLAAWVLTALAAWGPEEVAQGSGLGEDQGWLGV